MNELIREYLSQNLLRKVFTYGFPRLVAAEPLQRGQTSRQVHYATIYQGCTNFQAVIHACDINLGQNVAGKVGLKIQVLCIRQSVPLSSFDVCILKDFTAGRHRVVKFRVPERTTMLLTDVKNQFLPFRQLITILQKRLQSCLVDCIADRMS